MAHCDEALKEIGQVLKAYRKSHEGKNPPSLQTLVEEMNLSPWRLCCSAGGGAIGDCSYVYRGDDLFTGAPDEMVVAFDKELWHKNRRNVLFFGGHVQRPKEEDFAQLIQDDNELRRIYGLPEKPW